MAKQSRNSVRPNKNSSKVTQPISLKMVMFSVAFLLVALTVGLIIRSYRYSLIEKEYVQAAKTAETPEVPEITEIAREPEIPVVEDWSPEEVIRYEPEPEWEPEPEPEVQESNERFFAQDEEFYHDRLQDAQQWFSWFSELPAEYRQQLMQNTFTSFMSLMQRWQTIPEEQAMAERAELRGVFQQWQELPPEERQLGIQAIQQRLEMVLNEQMWGEY
jgi:hypothetical protein